MLISFKCENFRSIRDLQELSMISGETRNHPEQITSFGEIGILKSALIYGGNGSGKSNIYKAIRFSRDVIMSHTELKKFPSQEYKLDKRYSNKNSLFEYEIIIEGIFYRYGFEILLSEFKIINEWMDQIDKNLNTVEIFRRTDDNCCYRNKKIDCSIDKLFIWNVKNKEFSNDKNNATIKIIFDWFWNSLAVLKPSGSLLWDFDFDNEENLEKMTKILSTFDTGILDLKFIKHENGDETLKRVNNIRTKNLNSKIIRGNNVVYKEVEYDQALVLRGIHGESERIPINSNEESDGTMQLINLAPILISDDKDITYVIDEFDRCLHPEVVYYFIKWFLNKNYKFSKQLIITTHEPRLLDQDLIRRDEIWFVDKSKDGSSELLPLDRYKIRFDKKLDKPYFKGYFGGIPKIKLPNDL